MRSEEKRNTEISLARAIRQDGFPCIVGVISKAKQSRVVSAGNNFASCLSKVITIILDMAGIELFASRKSSMVLLDFENRRTLKTLTAVDTLASLLRGVDEGFASAAALNGQVTQRCKDFLPLLLNDSVGGVIANHDFMAKCFLKGLPHELRIERAKLDFICMDTAHRSVGIIAGVPHKHRIAAVELAFKLFCQTRAHCTLAF